MKRLLFTLLVFSAVVAVITTVLYSSGFTENFSSLRFQRRNIDTIFTLWTNGFLGTFFNVKFFGIVPVISFLLCLGFLSNMCNLKRSELAFMLLMIIMSFVIGYGGYHNGRYSFSLLPAHVMLVVYFIATRVKNETNLNIFNKVYSFKKSLIINILLIALLSIVIIKVYHLSSIFEKSVVNSFNFYGLKFSENSLSNMEEENLESFSKQISVYLEENPGKVLVVNMPAFFYYLDMPGIMFRTFPECVYKSNECLADELRSKKIRYIYVHSSHLDIVDKYTALKELLKYKKKVLSYKTYTLFEI